MQEINLLMEFGRTPVKGFHLVHFEWILTRVFLVKSLHFIDFEWILAPVSWYL